MKRMLSLSPLLDPTSGELRAPPVTVNTVLMHFRRKSKRLVSLEHTNSRFRSRVGTSTSRSSIQIGSFCMIDCSRCMAAPRSCAMAAY
jgi:hypothetical protein